MEKYTLIGHPLEHSMSPFIHERLFAMSGKEAEYSLTDIAPENLTEKKSFFTRFEGIQHYNPPQDGDHSLSRQTRR